MKNFDLPNNVHFVQYIDNSIELITEQGGLTDNELSAFRNEMVEYGLFVSDKVPFLLIDLNIMQFDFAFNAFHLLKNKSDNFLKHYSGSASLIIVAPGNHIPKVVREIRFKKHFTTYFKNCLIDELRFFENEQAVKDRLSELEKKLSLKEMIINTEMYISY